MNCNQCHHNYITGVSRRLFRLATWVTLGLSTWGCARLPLPLTKKLAPAPASAAATTVLGHPEETRLGKELLNQLSAHPGLSGFYLLNSGMDAFLARALMIDAAEHSIDLQYYIVDNDVTTQLLFERLLRAADRGVLVRMLIDDAHVSGLGLEELNAHRNIIVRTFNPYQVGFLGNFSRPFKFFLDLRKTNHRMHNKLLSVDGQAAITGGRNLADAYYEARPGLIFMDLDLWAVGPVVDDMEREFDEYWSSPWAVPISHFSLFPSVPDDVKKIRRRLAEKERETEKTEYAVALKNSDLLQRLEHGDLKLVWAKAEVAYDSPQKVDGRVMSHHVGPEIRALAHDTKSEVVFISPYFIPQSDGMKMVADLRRRGVRVVVLTNALKATDIVPAYAAFSRYREALLKLGVEIYEMKPTAQFQRSMGRRLFGSESRSSLHAKSYIFDRQTVLVGSFNLDPRSKHLNTEMGLIVHSPELAEQVYALFQEAASLRNSYRIILETPPGGGTPRQVWLTEDKQGKVVRQYHEPGKGFELHLSNGLLRLFPLEGQL